MKYFLILPMFLMVSILAHGSTFYLMTAKRATNLGHVGFSVAACNVDPGGQILVDQIPNGTYHRASNTRPSFAHIVGGCGPANDVHRCPQLGTYDQNDWDVKVASAQDLCTQPSQLSSPLYCDFYFEHNGNPPGENNCYP